jgi:hypothetical protein
VDWGEIWRTVEKVTPEEWAALRAKLKETYAKTATQWREFESWDDEDVLGGALAVVVHTAYHLGEIRQALCLLKG